MLETRDILNSYYGYPEKSEKVKIAMGKGKKHNYQDLEKAFSHAEIAFEGITNKDESGLVNQEFTAAIDLWKKAIAESDGGAKSRISYDIQMMLKYNCVLAHMWMYDFDQAKVKLYEANAMITDKTKGSEIRQLEELGEEISDKEQRFLANQ